MCRWIVSVRPSDLTPAASLLSSVVRSDSGGSVTISQGASPGQRFQVIGSAADNTGTEAKRIRINERVRYFIYKSYYFPFENPSIHSTNSPSNSINALRRRMSFPKTYSVSHHPFAHLSSYKKLTTTSLQPLSERFVH